MSLPRNLSVKKIKGEWILIQKPVSITNSLRKELYKGTNILVGNKKTLPVKSNQFELQVDLQPSENATCGLRLATGNNKYFEIGYHAATSTFYIDRSKTGNVSFNDNFAKQGLFKKLIPLTSNRIHLQVFYDNSIIEIFVNGGEAVFTAQIFGDKTEKGIELFNTGFKSQFSKLQIWEMKSIW
jgi:sucrose-6-phosphate hydrolase SacC (GH32 family)